MRLLSVLARSVLSIRPLIPASKRIILVYHDASEMCAAHHSPLYSTPPDTFRKHLTLLTRHFDFVSLDSILAINHVIPSRPQVALTFDDGFATVADTVFPLLSLLRIPFAVFVNARAMRTGRLEYSAQYSIPQAGHSAGVYMTEAQVVSLFHSGVLIGSHTTTHRVLSNCSEADLYSEIRGNKDYLEKLLGRPVRHFAIPYGKREHYNDHCLHLCRAAGHSHIFSTNPTFFDCHTLRKPTPVVPRIAVTNESPLELLFPLNRPLLRTMDL